MTMESKCHVICRSCGLYISDLLPTEFWAWKEDGTRSCKIAHHSFDCFKYMHDVCFPFRSKMPFHHVNKSVNKTKDNDLQYPSITCSPSNPGWDYIFYQRLFIILLYLITYINFIFPFDLIEAWQISFNIWKWK